MAGLEEAGAAHRRPPEDGEAAREQGLGRSRCGEAPPASAAPGGFGCGLASRRGGRGGGCGRALLLMLVSVSVLPLSRAQLCPYLTIPTAITGVEDVPVDATQQWINEWGSTNGLNGSRIYHGGCASSPGFSPTWGDAAERILFTIQVEYGRVFLRNGYPVCGAQSIMLDQAVRPEYHTALVVTDTFATLNCLLQYVGFGGMPNQNVATQLATYGALPRIVVTAGPPPSGQQTFQQIYTTTTRVSLSEVNDPPAVSACPLTYVRNDGAVPYPNQDQNGIVRWQRGDGGAKCAALTLSPDPGSAALATDPLPLGWQASPTSPPSGGSPVPPTSVTPAACQSSDPAGINPPYCPDFFPTNPPCEGGAGSYAYHIEDYEDAALHVEGMRIWDYDHWQAKLSLSFALRFVLGTGGMPNADSQSTGTEQLLQSFLGTFTEFCALPSDWRKGACAPVGDLDGVLGGLRVFDSQLIAIDVLPNMIVPTVSPGTCAFDDNSINPSCKYTAATKDCACKSKVYGRQNGQHQAIMFVRIRDSVNASLVWETGYMDLAYASPVNGETSVTGVLVTYAGKSGGAVLADLYPGSPMDVTGTYRIDSSGGTTTHRFFLRAVTQPASVPTFTVSVATSHGSIATPNAAINLNVSRPKIVTFTGNIVDINRVVSDVRYRVPGAAKPFFNTMSKASSLYGAVSERVLVTVDDHGSSGAPSAYANTFSTKYGRLLGTSTLIDYTIVVVAANNPPNVTSLASVVVDEDAVLPLVGITLQDVDASDVLLGMAGPANGAAIKLTLTCKHGVLRLPQAPPASGNVTVVVPLAPLCASQCASAYAPFAGTPSLEDFLTFSAACQSCQGAQGLALASSSGARSVQVYASLPTAQALLAGLTYKGDPGYNYKNPESYMPFSSTGCALEAPAGASPTSTEEVVVVADDLSNSGCLEQSFKISQTKMLLTVNPVDDAPQIVLTRTSVDVCVPAAPFPVGCDPTDPSSCSGCVGGRPMVHSMEGADVPFSADWSLQIRDQDSQDNDFDTTVVYVLALTVTHGALLFSNRGEGLVGVDFVAGAGACTTCRSHQLRGKMCDLNAALARLVYRPDAAFNTDVYATEGLEASVVQGGTSSVGNVSVGFRITGINNPPTVNLLLSGSNELAISTAYTDFYERRAGLPGGGVTCNADGVVCWDLSDVDVCEKQYVLQRKTLNSLAGVQDSSDPACTNASMGPGYEKVGMVQVTITVQFGNIWFYPHRSTEKWPPGPEASPPIDVGRESRQLVLKHPLSWFKGGLLRYYASASLLRQDTLSIAIDDFGNSGLPAPPPPEAPAGAGAFCCCTTQSCGQCDYKGTCQFKLDVTSCRDVSGWSCSDSTSEEPMPGYVIAIIVAGGILLLGAMVGVAIYMGMRQQAAIEAEILKMESGEHQFKGDDHEQAVEPRKADKAEGVDTLVAL